MAQRRIGQRVKSLREDRDLDVGQLAYKSGVSVSMIHRIEAGDRPNTSGVILARLADALDTSTDYLLGRTNDPSPLLHPPGVSPQVQTYVARALDIWTELEQVAPDLLQRAVTLLTSQTELLIAAREAMRRPEATPQPTEEHETDLNGR